MKQSTKKMAPAPAAVHYVPAEMFDVSKVIRGTGECEVACAAVEKRFSTSAKKHFFGLRTPVPFAVEIPVGDDAVAFEASCGVDAAGAKGKVALKVLADGREVWSGVVATGNKADLKACASLGRKSREKWIHCGLQEVNDSVIGPRIRITYDGRNLVCGSFNIRLEGERTATGKVPVSFFGMTCEDGSAKAYGCYDLSFYGATFYKDGRKVAEFVPVVKGGVAGLFETTSKKFHASATDVPLEPGPRVADTATREADAGGAGKKAVSDFSIPVFEDDFSEPRVFAERWNLLGQAQKGIVVRDGAVRFPGNTGDGIGWKGELPDEFAAEAVIVNYPEWSETKDPRDGDYHWAGMGCDYGCFSVRSDGYGVWLYRLPPPADQTTKGAYPLIANYRSGDEWRVYAVNIDPHPNDRVDFKLPDDIPQDARIEVLYENRTLQAKGGLFADAFDGFSRHVYRIVGP